MVNFINEQAANIFHQLDITRARGIKCAIVQLDLPVNDQHT
jgi:hypothetical protein